MLTKAITVSTKGEKATFSIKLSGKGHNSLDFFCNTCHSEKPIVSILDSSENCFLFFKRTEDGFELKYGVFYRFCQKAANHPDKDHTLSSQGYPLHQTHRS